MDKKEILEILLDWNFWKKDQYTGTRREGLVEHNRKKSTS